MRGLFDLIEPAVEAQPEERPATGTEGGSGCETDIGPIDDVESSGPRIDNPVD